MSEPLAASLLMTFQGRRDGEVLDYSSFICQPVREEKPDVADGKPATEVDQQSYDQKKVANTCREIPTPNTPPVGTSPCFEVVECYVKAGN